MQNKFKYNFSKTTKILLFSIVGFWVAIEFYYLAKLLNWFGLFSNNLVFEIIMMILGILCIVVLLFLFFTSYKIVKKKSGKYYLTLKTAFLDSLMSKAEINIIAEIILIKNTNELFLNFCAIDGTITIIKININAKNYQKFVDAIRSVNANALYTINDEQK